MKITLYVTAGIVKQVERAKNPASQQQICCKVVDGEAPTKPGRVTIPEVGAFAVGDVNEKGFQIWGTHQSGPEFSALYSKLAEHIGDRFATEAEYTEGEVAGGVALDLASIL